MTKQELLKSWLDYVYALTQSEYLYATRGEYGQAQTCKDKALLLTTCINELEQVEQ